MTKTAIVTGANGGIGSYISNALTVSGWRVIGIDKVFDKGFFSEDNFLMDLEKFGEDDCFHDIQLKRLKECLKDDKLDLLINNAAVQLVKPLEQISRLDFQKVLNINLVSAFLLSRDLVPCLEKARGSIINITSIHANLTKPYFSTYAISKAALTGLTKALAVELGSRVRVNAICPAAIDTEMLRSGFVGNEQNLLRLGKFHPSGEIGSVDNVFEAIQYLAGSKNNFLNGVILNIDGGISSRLHDPQ
ncbi:SDR family NAD(P)-dependent oxidoreductase [Polynucleobacter sp. UB-Siik-W21]|uniref:SDR family NAD(P)-dependent oxidoreductase n=1 Tax=Polynucleobacter sp. UB-Siik-W21 TaxID=1855646 RepID=UPI001BFDACE4|nr:SDR family oxidoreductase [Polynucleobacter sp. UB-Siik-W21]QWD70702.1 SDR family oxidoreductase [Polynucleobacter sp. UB-Siik-W21]